MAMAPCTSLHGLRNRSDARSTLQPRTRLSSKFSSDLGFRLLHGNTYGIAAQAVNRPSCWPNNADLALHVQSILDNSQQWTIYSSALCQCAEPRLLPCNLIGSHSSLQTHSVLAMMMSVSLVFDDASNDQTKDKYSIYKITLLLLSLTVSKRTSESKPSVAIVFFLIDFCKTNCYKLLSVFFVAVWQSDRNIVLRADRTFAEHYKRRSCASA